MDTKHTQFTLKMVIKCNFFVKNAFLLGYPKGAFCLLQMHLICGTINKNLPTHKGAIMLVAVVLGNRLNDDGTPTELMLKRMQLTLEMYVKFNPDKIILSGGLANKKAGLTEAQFMHKYLVEKGLPTDVLVEENNSLTTAQNAQFSVPMALEMGADELVVVTTAEHMSRSILNPLKLFQKHLKGKNITLYGFCSD